MKIKKFLFNSLPCYVLLITSYFINIPSANSQWVKSIGGKDADFGQSITSDEHGNVYVIGDFRGKADFDPGPDTYYLESSSAGSVSDPLKPDVFFAKYTKKGTLVWARKAGGSGDDNGKSIGVDDFGNVYITGTFELIADFDPSSTNYNLTSNGGLDIFLAKYNSNGELKWANNIGGDFFDFGNALSVSKTGVVTVAGSFGGNVDFDPTAGSMFVDAGESSDPFFARYNAHGKLIWVKDIAGDGESAAQSIFVDMSGDIYITGDFFGTSDFDPGAGTFSLTGIDAKDPFYAKYTAQGKLIWAASVAGFGDQTGLDIAADNTGNAYITGYFTGTVDFDPGAGTYNLSSLGNFNAYVLKLNKNGSFVWVNNIGGSLDDIGLSVAIDAKQNVYATGYFGGTASFNPATILTSAGSTDIYLAGYNPSGKLLLARRAGGTTDDWSNAIATDADGFVYVTGYYTGAASFAAGGISVTLTSAGNADAYMLIFKSLMNTGIASEESTLNLTQKITIDQSKAVVVSPNPAKDFITIKAPSYKGKIALQVYDASGKLLIHKQTQNAYQYNININNLSQGRYTLHIADDKGNSTSAEWIKE